MQPASTVLLTGFEPFDGRAVNASWEALQGLQGGEILGHRVETLCLPVAYDALAEPLLAGLARHTPRVAIAFGEGPPVVQIEMLARNGYAPEGRLDNRGRAPSRREIVPGAAEEIPTRLPAGELVAALLAAGVPARTSADCGGYLCNECFYRLMQAAPGPALRGFVHVPIVGAPDATGGVFDAEKLRKAARIVVEITLRAAMGNKSVEQCFGVNAN